MFVEKTFKQFLVEEERSIGTIEKYIRDVRAFDEWLDGREVTKLTLLEWKGYLLDEKYKPVTVNAMLASVNAYLKFIGKEDCKVKGLHIG